MKTETTKPSRVSLFQVVNDSQTPIDKGVLQMIYKIDFHRRRLAQFDDKPVHDAAALDPTWFANYE